MHTQASRVPRCSNTKPIRRDGSRHWMRLITLFCVLATFNTFALGQARSQRRIGTAEPEFLSPTFHRIAYNSVGGLTDTGEVIGFTGYELDDSLAPGTSAIAWKWTLDGGFAFTPPSEAASPPVSAHNLDPYPYMNATQHGLGFYSAEPGGRILAFASDNRTENPGITGFLNQHPITTPTTTAPSFRAETSSAPQGGRTHA